MDPLELAAAPLPLLDDARWPLAPVDEAAALEPEAPEAPLEDEAEAGPGGSAGRSCPVLDADPAEEELAAAAALLEPCAVVLVLEAELEAAIDPLVPAGAPRVSPDPQPAAASAASNAKRRRRSTEAEGSPFDSPQWWIVVAALWKRARADTTAERQSFAKEQPAAASVEGAER